MCLCLQPFRHDTSRLCDERDSGTPEPVTDEFDGPGVILDDRGLTYVAVRHCDIDRFSAK